MLRHQVWFITSWRTKCSFSPLTFTFFFPLYNLTQNEGRKGPASSRHTEGHETHWLHWFQPLSKTVPGFKVAREGFLLMCWGTGFYCMSHVASGYVCATDSQHLLSDNTIKSSSWIISTHFTPALSLTKVHLPVQHPSGPGSRTSRDRESTTSLNNLFHWLIAITIKGLLLIYHTNLSAFSFQPPFHIIFCLSKAPSEEAKGPTWT